MTTLDDVFGVLWSSRLSIWRAVCPLPLLLLRHKNEDLSTPVTVYLSNCLACPWVKRHHHPVVHTAIYCPFRVRMQNKPFIDSSCLCTVRHSSWLLITTETDKDRFTESHPLRQSILHHCYTVVYWYDRTYQCTMYTQLDNWLMGFTFQLEFDHFSTQTLFSCLTTATEHRHGHPLTSKTLDIVNHS